MLTRTPYYARRDRDGLALIGPSRFDIAGIRFMADNEGADGAGDGGFPADTPVKDMTAEQQAAYWKHQSRKHENRATAYGGLTPDQVQAIKDENEQLRQAGLSDQQRAIDEAKASGRNEVIGLLATERVTTAIERALQGRDVDPAKLLTLDRSSFIDGDKADTAKITAWVNENTTEKKAAPGAHLPRFQGQHEQIETTGRATGEAEAERRFGKKTK
ncbi:hypothetical protein P2P98_03135 [Microbacterium sp. Kw_RZR3]|uniref:hypothetical protein n=1 Tax=Microbacterium sp. Kw_RZR3 TaxID=3032903 RepID=UPI0023DC0032|nr:hypothetical protein [Microbacterium sp. Kw_RZR3]MDF2045143.1 hypothetical protein [Microbacterium sp. Kw_RZR3]